MDQFVDKIRKEFRRIVQKVASSYRVRSRKQYNHPYPSWWTPTHLSEYKLDGEKRLNFSL